MVISSLLFYTKKQLKVKSITLLSSPFSNLFLPFLSLLTKSKNLQKKKNKEKSLQSGRELKEIKFSLYPTCGEEQSAQVRRRRRQMGRAKDRGEQLRKWHSISRIEHTSKSGQFQDLRVNSIQIKSYTVRSHRISANLF